MKFYFTLIAMMIFRSAFSQWTVDEKEKVSVVKNSTIAVVIKEYDQKVLNDLRKKPNEQSDYKEGIDLFNKSLKDVMEKDWRYSNGIVFVTEEEARKLKEMRTKGYCIMDLIELDNYKMGDFYSSKPNNPFNTLANRSYHLSHTGKLLALVIRSAENSKETLVSAHLPSLGFSYTSVKFMIQFIQHQMEYCEANGITKYPQLKKLVSSRSSGGRNKTLLLYDPLIGKSIKKDIEGSGLKKVYPGSTEVIDVDKLNSIVSEKDARYMYILTVPSGAEDHGIVLHQNFVVDALDGSILFINDKTVPGSVGQFHEYHLKQLSKVINE